jgi:hypothetical protein
MTASTSSAGAPIALAPQVHAVNIGDDTVFLDLSRDAYFCLPGGGRAIRLGGGRRAALLAPELRQHLAQARLICEKVCEPDRMADDDPPPPPPSRSALPECWATPRMPDLPGAVAVLGDVLTGYWRRPLAELVATARAERLQSRRESPTPELLDVVASFHRWAPYAPTPDKCLLRSFMLLRALRRAGHDADWVFGVRTWPFRAHCWLQCGDTALDEDVEHLVAMRPILVV